LYSPDGSNFLESLERPQPYRRCRQDCEKFFALFREARESLELQTESKVFDLSMVFLGIRNFATCYSLGTPGKQDFSRRSALQLGDRSLSIPSNAYNVIEKARILCTRGIGDSITDQEAQIAFEQFPHIAEWMGELLKEVRQSCSTSLTTG
jgi:hypothetical protein